MMMLLPQRRRRRQKKLATFLGGNVLKAASAMTVALHWSVCVKVSRQLGPGLHLSPGRRAGPDVVPALSRALAAGGQAPLPHGQEGVEGVDTCDQEAEDLHRMATGSRNTRVG